MVSPSLAFNVQRSALSASRSLRYFAALRETEI
jgi:hypothetical protein